MSPGSIRPCARVAIDGKRECSLVGRSSRARIWIAVGRRHGSVRRPCVEPTAYEPVDRPGRRSEHIGPIHAGPDGWSRRCTRSWNWEAAARTVLVAPGGLQAFPAWTYSFPGARRAAEIRSGPGCRGLHRGRVRGIPMSVARNSGHYAIEFLRNTALKVWVACTAVRIQDRRAGGAAKPLEPEFQAEPERSPVVERVGDLSEVRRGQLTARLGELGVIEEIQGLCSE